MTYRGKGGTGVGGGHRAHDRQWRSADVTSKLGGPLTGLRIVEIDAIGPVPLAAMIMADMGAEIVRVGRRVPPGKQVWGDVGGADFIAAAPMSRSI